MENGPTSLRLSRTERTGLGHSVDCSVSELRSHPSYVRHKVSVQTSQLAALAQSGELAFEYPLIITRDRFIVDGYARLELAKRQRRAVLPCVEYDLDEQQSLQWLIETHRPSHGLSDFIRIELALDLEAHFKNKASVNIQEGGRLKGLSTLTEAEKIDARREIARLACVSVGNVHKVKYVLGHAYAPLKEAARTGELSINRAEKWSHETESRQLENLRVFRIERGIRKKARHLVALEVAATPVAEPREPVITLSDFAGFIHQLTATTSERCNEFCSIEVRSVRGPGRAVFVTEELMNALKPQQKVLVR